MTRFERALAFQHALGPKPSEVDRTPPHPVKWFSLESWFNIFEECINFSLHLIFSGFRIYAIPFNSVYFDALACYEYIPNMVMFHLSFMLVPVYFKVNFAASNNYIKIKKIFIKMIFPCIWYVVIIKNLDPKSFGIWWNVSGVPTIMSSVCNTLQNFP